MALRDITPQECLLCSVNLIKQEVAEHPENLLDYIQDYRSTKIPEGDIITQKLTPAFKLETHTCETATANREFLAVSFGLQGEYANYSGSVQATASQESYQATTTFHFGCTCSIDIGSTYFSRIDDLNSIRSFLKPELLHSLNAIKDLASARDFVNQYGTHLIMGLHLGGRIYIHITADTETLDEKSKVEVSATAAYKGAASVRATASVTTNLEWQNSSSNYRAKISAMGGTVGTLNPHKPDTFDDWAKSCSEKTSSGIYNFKPFHGLAEDHQAKSTLRLYLDLKVLEQSLRHPTYFSVCQPLKPYTTNVVSVTAPTGYRFIAGGATVTRDSTSFLTACYPDDTSLVRWFAETHDVIAAAKLTEFVTVYGIAVYDPNKHLDIKVEKESGTNTRGGVDQASAEVPDGYVLTGGGVFADCRDGTVPKFIYASMPADTSSTNRKWSGVVQDYKDGANDVDLTVYAIGVKQEHLNITPEWFRTRQGRVNHGAIAVTTQGPVVSGGVQVVLIDKGMGNLLQECYPSSVNSWQEYNKDTAGYYTYVNVTGFAMQLNATIKY
jgi:hypothetical protein